MKLSLCNSCNCMTKTIKGVCGKCGQGKENLGKPKELDWSKIWFRIKNGKLELAGTGTIELLEFLTQQRTELETHFSKEKRELLEEIKNYGGELIEQYFPKNKCKERGQAMVLFAMLIVRITNLLNKKDDR